MCRFIPPLIVLVRLVPQDLYSSLCASLLTVLHEKKFFSLDPRPSTPDPRPPTSDPRPSTLDPRPSTLDPRPSTLDPRPSTLDPRPSTLDPRPSTLDKNLHSIFAHRFSGYASTN